MGYFTWTDAKKYFTKSEISGISYKDKIKYDKYAKIVCPDDSEIIEPCYEGYGRFDGKDVHELVVDWNKEHLEEIFSGFSEDKWGYNLKSLAIAYQNDDFDTINSEIKRLIDSGKEPFWFSKEWKRSIGIAISCYDNEKLPFPIKITSLKTHKKYNELFPSISCQ